MYALNYQHILRRPSVLNWDFFFKSTNHMSPPVVWIRNSFYISCWNSWVRFVLKLLQKDPCFESQDCFYVVPVLLKISTIGYFKPWIQHTCTYSSQWAGNISPQTSSGNPSTNKKLPRTWLELSHFESHVETVKDIIAN